MATPAKLNVDVRLIEVHRNLETMPPDLEIRTALAQFELCLVGSGGLCQAQHFYGFADQVLVENLDHQNSNRPFDSKHVDQALAGDHPRLVGQRLKQSIRTTFAVGDVHLK